MERERIISELKKFFTVKELVCAHTFARFGQRSWDFLDTDFLHCLLIIRRDILQRPMTCNYSGSFQRGLRCNMCSTVKAKTMAYLSAHILGKAGDFTINGMTAEECRKKIADMAYLLPCQVRMEQGVSWLHFDVRPTYGNTDKVILFKG